MESNHSLDPQRDAMSGTHSEVFYGQRTRLILVVLLLLTVVAAASALFVRYRLELLKALVQREVQTRAGLAFQFRNVEVNGLYGFRILDVSASLKTPLGPFLQINVPKLEADIDLAELIYGNLSVQRIRADHSEIEIMRQPGGQWLTPRSESAVEHVSSLALPPFRVVGRECRLIARNVVGETTLTLQRLAFDIGRPPDSTEISARMSGDLGSPEFPKETVLNLRFVSAEDFDLRVEAKNVSAENVNVFLPASRHIVQSGVIAPTVRVAGYPGQMLTLSLDAPYEDLVFREQPEFIDPFTGKLTALGQYDIRRHLFSLATAKTRAQAFEGNVDGSVDFSQSHPVLDLRMRAEKTPLASLLGAFLPDALSEYGALNVEMAAPAQLMVTLTGSTEEPVVGAKALMDDVKFTFTDNAAREAVLDVRKGEATWDSSVRAPTARFEVVRGSVNLNDIGVAFSDISGTVIFDGSQVYADPITARLNEANCRGSARYDLPGNALEATLEGTFASQDRKIREARLNGEIGFKAQFRAKDKRTELDGELDLTQCGVAWPPVIAKPVGMNLRLLGIHAEGRDLKAWNTSFKVEGLGTCAEANTVIQRGETGWMVGDGRIEVSQLNLGDIGMAITQPYAINGDKAARGTLHWEKRDGQSGFSWGGVLDSKAITITSNETGGTLTVEAPNVTCEFSPEGEGRGHVTIKAKTASTPPVWEHWFHSTAESHASSAMKASWNFDIETGAINVPPWEGTDFHASAYVKPGEAGFSRFSAQVAGGGSIEGKYVYQRALHITDFDAAWHDVPAVYLLRQIRKPEILNGTSIGNISYHLDRDDPASLRGSGHVEVSGGHFSADYLLGLLESRNRHEAQVLPASLRFDLLSADYALEGDCVRTPNLKLTSKGVEMDASGQFVVQGDLNYQIRVKLSTEMAQRIPALRDNLNLGGMRLAGNSVDIALNISGPTFNPTSSVTDTPALGVTLAGGALQLTDEALKVVDLPRRILEDLLRLGGGIVMGK